jgi:acyl carrier protein
MSIAEKIREFIRENLLYGSDRAIGDDDSLLDTGVIDSTGAMELVTFLESAFEIEIDDRDLIPENLDSINAMCAFVLRKQNQQPSGDEALAKRA